MDQIFSNNITEKSVDKNIAVLIRKWEINLHEVIFHQNKLSAGVGRNTAGLDAVSDKWGCE